MRSQAFVPGAACLTSFGVARRLRAMPEAGTPRSRLQFGSRNSVLLGAAAVSLALGYWLLSRGSTAAAPLLLVLGYCVFFPVGLAL